MTVQQEADLDLALFDEFGSGVDQLSLDNREIAEEMLIENYPVEDVIDRLAWEDWS